MATLPRSVWCRNVDAGWSFFGAPAARPQPEEALPDADFAHQIGGQVGQCLEPGHGLEIMDRSACFPDQMAQRLLAAHFARFADMAEAVESIEPEQRRQQEVEIPIAEAERQIGENAVGAHPASDEFEPAGRKAIGARAAEYGRAARTDGRDHRART